VDSAGLDISGDEPALPDWFKERAESYAVEAGSTPPPPTAFGCYVSMRLSKDMCNPDLAPGTPGACAGSNQVMTYPVPLGLPVNVGALTFMNNAASAWLPRRAGFCSGSAVANLRAFNKWFYLQQIGGTTSVCISNSCNPTSPSLYVPFRGSLAIYDNRISSFITWESQF
jgi:hypothetical protein